MNLNDICIMDIKQIVKETPNNMELGEKIRNMFNNGLDKDNDSYIYESPDGGKTIYRRKLGDYDNRKLIKD